MKSHQYLHLIISLAWFAEYSYSIPMPEEYKLSFDTSDNPLNITVAQPYSSNYILLIADWGANPDTDYVGIQQGVANKMKQFYEMQKSKGKNLLFVGAIGDNFYSHGQTCHTYDLQWTDIYGDELTSVPWLSVMGNHDWGNFDCHAMCAFTDPKYIDTNTNIAYHCNQCPNNKNGCAPKNYYMPDFGYYYTIKELNFELIGLEQSFVDCPDGIGGSIQGRNLTWMSCNNSIIEGCHMLKKMADASELMMIERAQTSENSNFLIMQHFPIRGAMLLKKFKENRITPKDKQNNSNNNNNNNEDDIIYSAYGHAHSQQCDGYKHNNTNNNKDYCQLIMTGGGGGCCHEDTLRGFYVISFNDNKEMIQEYAINDTILTCQYPCNATINDIQALKIETCCTTVGDHGFDCSEFDLELECSNYADSYAFCT